MAGGETDERAKANQFYHKGWRIVFGMPRVITRSRNEVNPAMMAGDSLWVGCEVSFETWKTGAEMVSWLARYFEVCSHVFGYPRSDGFRGFSIVGLVPE